MVFVRGGFFYERVKMDMCKRVELRRYPSVLNFLLVLFTPMC